MTSKEIIQEVIKELEYCQKEDTMYEAETSLLLPDMEQVLNDLEILDIFKKNHSSTQQYVCGNTPIKTIISFSVSNEELNKIKEWLENDK